MVLEKFGILYVVTRHQRYIDEAINSARSVKKYWPEIKIALFSDIDVKPGREFDYVYKIPLSEKFRSSWGSSLLDRIKCLQKSPFEYTLHLDSDTIVRDPYFNNVFKLLNNHEIAMVPCGKESSKSMSILGVEKFNCGVILYRNTEKVQKLFATWELKTLENFRLANMDYVPDTLLVNNIADVETKRELLFNDQTSICLLLSPKTNVLDLKLNILENNWNYREGLDFVGNIIIDHRRINKRPGFLNKMRFFSWQNFIRRIILKIKF